MQQLCSSKFEQELTEQEFHLLQQQIDRYNSSCQSFESSTICKSILLDSIQDSNIRQQLLGQYQDIAQQSKMNMLTLFKESAKIQMDESKNKFEMAMKQTWYDRHLSSENDKIPLAIINLIEQRYKKISERIQCVYKFKTETILSIPISLLDKIYVIVSTMNVNNTNDLDDHRVPRQRRRKQCHGNRRDQRFRRKCRKRHMNEKTIKKLLNRRHQATTTTTTNNNNNNNNNMEIVNSNQRSTILNDTSKSTMINDNKRKRDVLSQKQKLNQIMIKSTSQLLIDPPLSKKMKKDSNRVNGTYRQPMYLKRLPLTFFPILSKKLNYTLKKKNERRIFYARLDLLDQQYCLEVDQHLWQSYLDIGLRKQIWPDQLYTMANANDFNLCQEYLINYINDIKQQLHQCQMELTKLYQSRPIATLSMNEVDRCLKEFVVCQRKYLSIRNNNQLVNFQDDLSEKELFTLVSAYSLTTNQNEHMHQLITIREQQVKLWEQLLMLRMRILDKFLPEHFDDLEHFIAPNIYSPVISNTIAIQFKNKRYKIIQEAKRSWLNIILHAYEIKIQEYDRQYQYELIQLKSQLLNSMTLNGESIVSSYRKILLQNRQRSLSSTKSIIGVCPEPYLDLMSNPFNTNEWNHLSLGPSCIRLNQSAIRPRHQQEIQIKKEYSDINQKVVQYLTSPPRNIPSRAMILKTYSDDLLNYFNHAYFAPQPYKDQTQALTQAIASLSIRRKIKKFNLILRVTDKSHNFYIGSAIEFEKEIQTFFQDTNAFVVLKENPFDEILNKVIQLLNRLIGKKLILQWQSKKMMPNRTKSIGIPVRPIENTIGAPTTNISDFLDEIIRLIFDSKCGSTSIIDGASLLEELYKYTKKGLFKVSTLFCTFDIRNLYTMLPQEEALDILIEFLQVHGYTKVKGISLDTIRILAFIVLRENVCVYNNKIYKQTLGGAMGSSFALTLANIFMWKWQKEFVRRQDISGEFYGRYIDDIFMTWNKSENELRNLLDTANSWHPNIKLEYKVSKSLPFLDVLLTNSNGILLTSVYHKPAAEPYVVPFSSDHPRHVFNNVVQTSLARAVRYCSTLEAFNHEQRYIQLALLYNGYPSTFIDREFQKFFFGYISSTSFLPIIDDEKQFLKMHRKLLDQPTLSQSQAAFSAAMADIDNDQTDETVNESKESKNYNDESKQHCNDKLIIHYTHEKRIHSFKKQMHRIYEHVFNNTPVSHVKMIVGNRNRQDAKRELIRKRPKQSLLQNKPIKRRRKKTKKIIKIKKPSMDQQQQQT
ncbi:unnamed protein product [Rotaria magnacalcarata]|uniref:Reverse transcriptase domain-containing protein n=3 Tax=Rotaria magnacalcarata TaxID=392030 RepID=A0A816WWW7_9BILA|nr:unnamed protein product [Rotaria magnacalcarata]